MPGPQLPLSDPEPTTKAPAERRKGDYTLPPLALLDAPKTERKIDERELMEGARLLEEKCREFSVEGSVVQIHPGPVVTPGTPAFLPPLKARGATADRLDLARWLVDPTHPLTTRVAANNVWRASRGRRFTSCSSPG